jgi:hypothetical protein
MLFHLIICAVSLQLREEHPRRHPQDGHHRRHLLTGHHQRHSLTKHPALPEGEASHRHGHPRRHLLPEDVALPNGQVHLACNDEQHKLRVFSGHASARDFEGVDRAKYEEVMASLKDGVHPQTLVMFFGYRRSGHSLVGSLLDAHPDAAIANEFNAMNAYYSGTGRSELFRELVSVSTAYKLVGRCQAGYEFKVPGASAHAFAAGQLKVVGDKLGGGSSDKHLSKKELAKFQKFIGVNVSLIHVVRDPLDIIASNFAVSYTQKRWKLQHDPSQHASLAANPTHVEAQGMKLKLNQTVDKTMEEITYNMKARSWIQSGELPGYRWIDVPIEAFSQSPQPQLERLCQFVGLDATKDSYLERAASIVRSEMHASRDELVWPTETYNRIQKELDRLGERYPDTASLWETHQPRHVGKAVQTE